MRNPIIAAVAAVLLFSSPAIAQSDLEARRAAAHALVDAPLAGFLHENAPGQRAQLALPGIKSSEQTALHKAFDEGFPAMVREAQDVAANAVADEWPLEQLRDPSNVDEARLDALIARMEPTMTALGERFAWKVIQTGCSADAEPSVSCTRILAGIRRMEAAR